METMISNAMSSNSTGVSKSARGTRCKHHSVAVVNVAGTPNNMGRSFYRCPYWRDRNVDCGFFRWVDQTPKVKEEGNSSTMQHRQYNQEDKDDGRAAAGEAILEEIRAIKQSVAVLEPRICYVLVCLCVLVVFIGFTLNK
ncbi:hypothetical protein LINPERHAP2_LOCUS37719 [Linum perenne]